MQADRQRMSAILAAAVLGLTGCVARTWESPHSVTEAAPPVGSHLRRTYKYGEPVPPAVNPRVKVEGEELRRLIEQLKLP